MNKVELIAQQMANGLGAQNIWSGIIINVKEYGAKGNGVKDDTASIQKAIDYANSIGKKEVTFPAGTYLYGELTNTLGLTFIGDGVTLDGGTPLNLTSFAALNAAVVQLNKSIDKTKTNILYANAINQMQSIPKSSMDIAKAAIAAGTIKIAFMGDSITENGDLLDPIDGYASMVINKLKTELKGVTVNGFNFALGGRGIGYAVSAEFVGGVSDGEMTFKRSWSVIGKPWRDHVKDFAPDLLFIACGMNDAGAYVDGHHAPHEYQYMQTGVLCDYTKTWAKKPSIVIIPTVLPTTNEEIMDQYFYIRQELIKAVARGSREYAKNNLYPIADANRLFTILRDGKDDAQRTSTIEQNWVGYSTGSWIGDTSSYALNGSDLIGVGHTNKYVIRNRPFYDGIIEFEFKPNDAAAYTWLDYRMDDIDLGSISILMIGGNVSMYANNTSIAGAGGQPMSVGTYYKFRVEVNGSNHKFYYNDALIFEYKSGKMLHQGSIRLGTNGAGLTDFRNLKIIYKDELTYGALLSEAELLGGAYNSRQSGNGFNHPSDTGHLLTYYAACESVLNKLISN